MGKSYSRAEQSRAEQSRAEQSRAAVRLLFSDIAAFAEQENTKIKPFFAKSTMISREMVF